MGECLIVDRLAEVMRISRYGLVRPLWQDMTDEARAPWLHRAGSLMGSMSVRGLIVVTVDEGEKSDA